MEGRSLTPHDEVEALPQGYWGATEGCHAGRLCSSEKAVWKCDGTLWRTEAWGRRCQTPGGVGSSCPRRGCHLPQLVTAR